MRETRKVKVKITETFKKIVECTVPADLESDEDTISWLEGNEDADILDTMSSVGVADPAEIDWKKTMEVVHGGDAS